MTKDNDIQTRADPTREYFIATGKPATNMISLTDGVSEAGKPTISGADLERLVDRIEVTDTKAPRAKQPALGGMNF